jgi:hypothetical protein
MEVKRCTAEAFCGLNAFTVKVFGQITVIFMPSVFIIIIFFKSLKNNKTASQG